MPGRLPLRAALALLLAGLGGAAAAADGAWQLEKEKDGIRIESRAVPGWSIHEIRGTARIAAPLATVVAVLDDVSAMPQLNDLVVEAHVLQRDDASHYRVYAAMDMPWPVSDRDIVNARVIARDAATGTVTISDDAVADAEPRKDYVRIARSHQRWTLTPTADGQVQAELRLLSDPGGMPAALINTMSVSAPMKTIEKVRVLARQPKYQQARTTTGGGSAGGG